MTILVILLAASVGAGTLDARPSFWERPLFSKIVTALLTIALSYLGYGEYEKRSGGDINIKVAAEHSHPPVVGRDAIKALIKSAVDDQHKANLSLFKQKESWE